MVISAYLDNDIRTFDTRRNSHNPKKINDKINSGNLSNRMIHTVRTGARFKKERVMLTVGPFSFHSTLLDFIPKSTYRPVQIEKSTFIATRWI